MMYNRLLSALKPYGLMIMFFMMWAGLNVNRIDASEEGKIDKIENGAQRDAQVRKLHNCAKEGYLIQLRQALWEIGPDEELEGKRPIEYAILPSIKEFIPVYLPTDEDMKLAELLLIYGAKLDSKVWDIIDDRVAYSIETYKMQFEKYSSFLGLFIQHDTRYPAEYRNNLLRKTYKAISSDEHPGFFDVVNRFSDPSMRQNALEKEDPVGDFYRNRI
ncbi:MAG: hypothetical protein K0R76_1545 [Alphaproteobacteria bacterium]|nr:hypothetical protein [Alphaproteobacteria bacterium]